MSAPGAGTGLTPNAGSLGPAAGRRVPVIAVAEDGSGGRAASRLSALPYHVGVEAVGRLVRSHPRGVMVTIWVVPGAGRDEIAGLHGDALRVRVMAPPEGGRASRAAAALVAGALGGRRAEVVAGWTARRKQVVVERVGREAAIERLAALLPGG